MKPRVTVEDLELAATWLEAYEPGPEGDEVESMAKVAVWLREEAKRRETAKVARQIARRVGLPARAPRVVEAAQQVMQERRRS